MESSHPIEVPVSHPDEINEIFDGISYAKGASVIRMLYDFIGQDIFMEGVQNYLNKFSYANAKTNDLWNEINQLYCQQLSSPSVHVPFTSTYKSYLPNLTSNAPEVYRSA